MTDSPTARPVPWRGMKPRATIWVDYKTGQGVTDDGTPVRPKIGERRKNPNLTDLLDTAQLLNAERIMLTGAIPRTGTTRHWLEARTPGWSVLGHWLEVPSTGRFQHDLTRDKVEIRTVEEWFGGVPLTATQARDAWVYLGACLRDAVADAQLIASPAATGANAWALGLPAGLEPTHIATKTAATVHSVSGQHRIEHLVAGRSGCACGDCRPMIDPQHTPRGQFAYVDGRFMYAAVLKGLGVGPGSYLDQDGATAMLHDPHGRYERALVNVRATVPDGWQHVGILPVKLPGSEHEWHYPNRPGATFETWADSSEVVLAIDHGWIVQPLRALHLTKSRVLDNFAEQMTRARARAEANLDAAPEVRAAAATALRAMVIQTIGTFARRAGRSEFRYAAGLDDLPHDVSPESVQTTADGRLRYTVRTELSSHAQRFHHPEYAAQVWGRARARLLDCPIARTPGQTGLARGGVLHTDPSTLIGLNGDALYATAVPTWAWPTERGGGDDGKIGRLRVKGVLDNTAVPTTVTERNKLREQAEAAGLPTPEGTTA